MFAHLKIWQKLVGILVFPIIALFGFASISIYTQSVIVLEIDKIEQLSEITSVFSGLVHEMQKERGYSALYISQQGKASAKNRLVTQRQDTDRALVAVNAAAKKFNLDDYDADLSNRLDTIQEAHKKLSSIRAAVTALDMTLPHMAQYYTGTIAKKLDFMGKMPTLSSIGSVTSRLIAYIALLQAKERAGLERAMGGAGFGADEFSTYTHRNFISLMAQQKAYLDIFNKNAPQDIVLQYDQIMLANPAVKEVDKMRKIAVEAGYGGATGDIKGSYWFDTITSKIDSLKEMEDLIADNIQQHTEEIRAEAVNILIFELIAAGAAISLAILVATLVCREIVASTNRLTHSMDALSSGNLEIQITGQNRRDEIGIMARAVRVFQKYMIERRDLAAQRQQQEHQLQRGQKLEHMAQNFDQQIVEMLAKLEDTHRSLAQAATDMNRITDDTGNRAQTASGASGEVNTNVQNISVAVEQLSTSIQEIGKRINDASQNATQAQNMANETNTVVSELSDAASQIGAVLNLISDIAEQTNLLALNATIEAARAGEAGKGFAVVASEVKNLANQTGQATEEISSKIKQMQEITTQAVQAIMAIVKRIDHISESITGIASGVEQQNVATRDITDSVVQAAKSVNSVNDNMELVNDGTSKSRAAGGSVNNAVQVMTENVVAVREQIQQFLHDVRTLYASRDTGSHDTAAE